MNHNEEEYDDIILKCLNDFFRGIKIEFGVDKILQVDSIVQCTELENEFSKNYGLLIDIKFDGYVRILFEPNEEFVDFSKLAIFDIFLFERDEEKIFSLVMKKKHSYYQDYRLRGGSVKYVVEEFEFASEELEKRFSEVQDKIDSGEDLNDMEKWNLMIYPLVGASEDGIIDKINEALRAIGGIRNDKERIMLLGAFAGVIEQMVHGNELIRIKEVLKVTEIGYLLKQEGIIYGIRESILTIIVNRCKSTPDYLYDKINSQKDESVLRKWLLVVVNCDDIENLILE